MHHRCIGEILYGTRDTRGNTALHDYVLNHEFMPHVMRNIIDNGARLKTRNVTGKTAFLLAVAHRQKEMVEFFIENKAKVNVKDKLGNSALHYIALHELNEYFMPDGQFSSTYDPTEEERFKFDDQYAILKMLLNAGADVNSSNRRGETPLMWAARGKHLKIVKLLLEFGANVHLRNHLRQTCLHVALNYENTAYPLCVRWWNKVNYAIVLELVRNEACVNCFDKQDMPAFQFVLQILPGINEDFAEKMMTEAALVNWRRRPDFYLDKRQILGQPGSENKLLVKHANNCYKEIDQMRVHELPGGSNLCLFARRGVSKDEKNYESEIKERVLEILLRNRKNFEIYLNFILFKFNKSFLLEKVYNMDVYTIRKMGEIEEKIELNIYVISLLCSDLENEDLFNLISAFHLETTIRGNS